MYYLHGSDCAHENNWYACCYMQPYRACFSEPALCDCQRETLWDPIFFCRCFFHGKWLWMKEITFLKKSSRQSAECELPRQICEQYCHRQKQAVTECNEIKIESTNQNKGSCWKQNDGTEGKRPPKTTRDWEKKVDLPREVFQELINTILNNLTPIQCK